MENVFDIKREKKLNYVLPTNVALGEVDYSNHKVLVIIHLYYQDTIDEYMYYVENIPEEIDLIFTVSNNAIKQCIDDRVKTIRKNYRFVHKENRGRDISAFLVACREIILDYEYVCFLHDKKEKSPDYYIDNRQWVGCLWENTLGSMSYIKNILWTLQTNEEIGVLVPPLPMSAHYSTAYTNSWGANFKNVVSLSKELNLICDLDETKNPITIGTVFWVKVEAVKKLFERNWNYNDFPQEPLDNDGTISHAIERSFAYIAQDAGFVTGWTMTDKFASDRMELMNDTMSKMSHILSERCHVHSIADVEKFDEDMDRLDDFIRKNSLIYIYGAGRMAKIYRNRLGLLGRFPDLYIVSKMNGNPEMIDKVPVVAIEDVDFSNKPGIIIGVGVKLKKEVLVQLKTILGEAYTNILIL